MVIFAFFLISYDPVNAKELTKVISYRIDHLNASAEGYVQQFSLCCKLRAKLL